MRKFLLLLLVPLLLSANEKAWPDSLMEEALSALDLRQEEMDLFPEVTDSDPFRLPWISHCMEKPGEFSGTSERILSGFRKADPFALQWAGEVSRLLFPGQELQPAPVEHMTLDEFMTACRKKRDRALEDLGSDEKAFLLEQGLSELERADLRGLEDLFEIHQREQEASARSDSLIGLWTRIDRALLMETALEFLSFMKQELQQMSSHSGSSPNLQGYRFPDGSFVEGPIHHVMESPHGHIVVGGHESNRYEGSFLLILDLGGDDIYRLGSCRPGASASGAWRAILDQSGSDRYESLEDASIAATYLGASLLIDESGDDHYLGKSHDIASGWLGLGVLIDRSGDDFYSGDRCSEGAGAGGIGLLIDESGSDIYRAHLYSQAFGFCGGMGHLLDKGGHDLYAAVPFYTDHLRYEDHAVTLSQGFGFGWRPHWSGGVGLLQDLEGNDHYLADNFGQGCSYWYALGLLEDRAGNDSYELWQYGQGSGIHLSLAALLDYGGNDSYSLHGVGQGCGHDLAFGLLYDRSGNDRYSCDDLSQGAGNANGIGILLDGAGRDGYLGKNLNAQGYGNRRRHFGSLGILLDAGGDDWYSEAGDGQEKRRSFRGALLDRELPRSIPSPWNPADAIPLIEEARSFDDYFLMASTGEPRFREWKKAGHDSLMADPEAAIPALILHFDTEDANERHALKNLMVDFGERAVDPLREVLRSPHPERWRLAAWSLENIGDARAFEELMLLLDSPRGKRDQISALAALARLRNLGKHRLQRLEAHCSGIPPESPVLVLKELAHLYDRQNIGSSRELLTLAAHDHAYVRWAAEEALSSRGNWAEDFGKIWKSSGGEQRRRLAPLLSHLSALRCRDLLRHSLRKPCSEELLRALRHALEDHPEGDGLALASLAGRLKGRP